MYGPGPGFTPTPRRRPHPAVLVTLRVLLVAITMLSVGFLGWVAMLRIAIMRSRALDWVLFCVTVILAFGALIFIGGSETEEPRDIDMALIGLLFLMSIAITTHYLVADIKHFAVHGRTPPGPYAPQQQQYGYGYPPFSATAQTRPQPQPQPVPPEPVRPRPVLPPPVRPPSVQPPPVQPPPVQPPSVQSQPSHTPPRIDQVRAELDELSDILRKGQEGR
ncbi:hypothetical protein ACFWM0_18660 [Streptomyces sp. NPDC058405]|uniref:hypothetical protein n=1 Tax=unclassified Streptomyces TaxID=2593676 RepID=UPI00364D4AA3